jgi:hypothetical protein
LGIINISFESRQDQTRFSEQRFVVSIEIRV